MTVPTSRSDKPHVPNHELIRAIGRGAYGEIWMARNEIGILRAVKVVERKTFESEKAFEREFEGMARFEPISRPAARRSAQTMRRSPAMPLPPARCS